MSIEELEGLRKRARNKVIIGAIITIIFFILLCIFTNLSQIGMIGLFVGIFITAIATNSAKKEFIKGFKDTFVLKSLQQTFANLYYNPDSGMDCNTIASTQMMHMGDRYSSNDLIIGTYKNIRVYQADVHIEERHTSTDSKGHTTTTWVTIFFGRWMVFDFNKQFKANIQVCQKGFGNAKIVNWGQHEIYKKVKMEDADFNKKFKIYAQNEHDAFYILTPHLMEKIKNLTDNIKGKILLCFVDNKLHIGIQNNKDSFEHSIFIKINEQKVLEEISQDIKLITSFVDELDLDNNLFIRKEVEYGPSTYNNSYSNSSMVYNNIK